MLTNDINQYSLFISRILTTCQYLALTLLMMKLDRQHFCQRFRCVMLVAANLALSRYLQAEMVKLVNSLLSNSTSSDAFDFQTCIFSIN